MTHYSEQSVSEVSRFWRIGRKGESIRRYGVSSLSATHPAKLNHQLNITQRLHAPGTRKVKTNSEALGDIAKTLRLNAYNVLLPREIIQLSTYFTCSEALDRSHGERALGSRTSTPEIAVELTSPYQYKG